MKFIDALHERAWRTVGGEDGPAPHPLPREGQLLTLEQWHAVRDTWPLGLRTGVILANTVDVETVAEDLPRLHAQHDGQVQPPLPGLHAGDVAYPGWRWARDGEAALEQVLG